MATAAMTMTAAAAANNLGRDKVHWNKDVWDRIDKAVHDEMMRTRVGQKFLPIRPVLPHTTTLPLDVVTRDATQTHIVDEGATTRINEYWVEFALTPQQVEQEARDTSEMGHSTAVTLATRAANLLSQAEDLVIFQGQNAINANNGLFQRGVVLNRGVPADSGLLDLPLGAGQQPPLPAVQAQPVLLKSQNAPNIYGENTFAAVALAYSNLQANGQYGPYALVLQTIPYADTYAPLPNTLILTADRITPLMTAGFYGTGTLPANFPASVSFNAPNPPAGNASFAGVLVSLGGNTMDFACGLDAITAFMQQDVNGNYRFRVLERFALRLKDTTGVIRLEFQ